MSKRKKYKYYAIWSENAIAVFDDWNLYTYEQYNFVKPRCKGFYSRADAEEKAIREYNCLKYLDLIEGFHGHLKLNRIYYLHKKTQW